LLGWWSRHDSSHVCSASTGADPLTGEHLLVSRIARSGRGGRARRDLGRRATGRTIRRAICGRATPASVATSIRVPRTFAFDNDFLRCSRPRPVTTRPRRVQIRCSDDAESGACRVVCFSPRHDVSLPELEVGDIESVLATWTEETRALSARPAIHHVQVFENKGEMMGCFQPASA